MQTQYSRTSVLFRYRMLAMAGAVATASTAHAAILIDLNGTPDFGWALGHGNDSLVVGAPGQSAPGAAYYYNNGTTLTLQKDGAQSGGSYFGYSVSASSNGALIGDFADTAGTSNVQVGAAYYYKDLDANTGSQPVTETLKLQASDGAANAYFGRSVSLSGDNALVGAFGDQYNATQKYVGAAYYFKNLDNATADANGVVTETLKLTSDRAEGQNAHFGLSQSLSGNNALVSAIGVSQNRGEVYYYGNLDSATAGADNTVKETFVLQASDGAAGDMFGRVVSLDGNAAIVGANGSQGKRGTAYYYKDLDNAAANTVVEETVRLFALDGQAGDEFGFHASLSNDSALVGARSHGSQTGAAYLFNNLSQAAAGSTVTENVMLTASDGRTGDVFGSSVALDGNRFAIGANRAGDTRTGKVYTGDVRTFTVLDAGNTALATDGLSFTTQDDWVIGATTSANSVRVSRDAVTGIADVAKVMASGKSIYIGKNAGANNNALRVDGELFANQIFVGATGNTGNTIFFNSDAYLTASSVNLALGNSIALIGSSLDYDDLLNWLALQGSIDLYANGSLVTTGTAGDLLSISTNDGYTIYTAVPEPSTYAALFGTIALGLIIARRNQR